MIAQTTDQGTYASESLANTVDSNASDAGSTACDENMDSRGMPAGCVFVASLSKLLKDSELSTSVLQHFSQWGLVLNVKVFRDWMQRPYGFVQFASQEDAQKALKEASGTLLNGRYIRCEPARVNRTIYLGQMPENTSKTEIQQLAESFGCIEDVTIIKTTATHSTTVGAFIRYQYRDDAIKAYLVLHHDPPFQAMTVEWATNLNQSSKKMNNLMEVASSSTLVIKNLPPGINQDDLRNYLMSSGNISSVVLVGKTPVRKRTAANNNDPRCAFVRYASYEDAKKAQEIENGKVWNGYKIKAFFKDCESLRNDSVKFDKFKKPYPPGQCVSSSMAKLNMARSQKTPDQIVNKTYSLNSSLVPSSSTYPRPQKRDYKPKGSLANSISQLCQYPAELQVRSVIQPCADGYQVPCSLMTYISSHYNSPDHSGLYYSLPMYQYCLDYGLGFYYANGYGYPGACYPVTPPTPFTSMPLSSAGRKTSSRQNSDCDRN
ncbi:hypothetical protein K450DRAFT_198156 [Umbelopsis ramanniana AG]|uniref:RRM domain-containing protein n=1 Tax=Umbelopsis ramanniana AG TaxID=1314678 RepID=A0AAD5ED45_UMBRA|nr:uncharacterized protein K450DRAFT_198156 [Umbelopsis ramanniana AG]KAI8581112.1 hypothetical protein K450DRAFT_198156 [Umbelopsis ramanniana AG]